jgi:hypothetical protein
MGGEGVSQLWGYSTLYKNRWVNAFVRNWVEGCGRLALNGVCQDKDSSSRTTANSPMRLKNQSGSGTHTHVASELPMVH